MKSHIHCLDFIKSKWELISFSTILLYNNRIRVLESLENKKGFLYFMFNSNYLVENIQRSYKKFKVILEIINKLLKALY